MIRTAICDDESFFVDQLKRILVSYGKTINEAMRVREFHDGRTLLSQFDCTFDIIFLDIKMPGMDGMQVAAEIRKKDPIVSIVFLTSLVDKAIESYRFRAADYLLKPAGEERIAEVIERWRQQFAENEPRSLLIENKSGQWRVPVASLRYVETYDRKLRLHVKEDKIVCYKKLKDLQQELEGSGFAQSQKGVLVNLSYIESTRTDTNEIVLVTGEVLPVSRTMKKDFMRQTARYWGEHI